jgi:hypothetical protein
MCIVLVLSGFLQFCHGRRELAFRFVTAVVSVFLRDCLLDYLQLLSNSLEEHCSCTDLMVIVSLSTAFVEHWMLPLFPCQCVLVLAWR